MARKLEDDWRVMKKVADCIEMGQMSGLGPCEECKAEWELGPDGGLMVRHHRLWCRIVLDRQSWQEKV